MQTKPAAYQNKRFSTSSRILIALALIAATQLRFSVSAGFARTDAAGTHAPNAQAVENKDFWRNWTSPANISQSAANEATWPTLDVADDGQKVYLAWSDGRDAPANIYYSLSSDGGQHWGNSQRVAQTGRESLRPSLVTSGGNATVVWADATVGLVHITYEMAIGGASPRTVPNDYDTLASAPRLVADGSGALHLALQGALLSQPDILYTYRAAAATSWPQATVAFTHNAIGSYNPSIAVSSDGGTVHLAWQENVGAAESAIYYMKGQQGGGNVTWGTPISISTGVTTAVRPAIALGSGSNVHLVWGEKAPDVETQYVRYARSGDGGAHWSAPSRIMAEPFSANSLAPTDVAPAIVATASGAICVAWHGFLPSASIEAEEIYLTCSLDGGASWGTPVNVSRSPNTISIRPVLATGSDNVLHIAWQEYTGPSAVNNYQVYYAQSIPSVVFLPITTKNW
jgi:hypothetical protein